MSTYKNLKSLVARLRDDLNNPTGPASLLLIYAYNRTGKTRLSMEFKDAGKRKNKRCQIALKGSPLIALKASPPASLVGRAGIAPAELVRVAGPGRFRRPAREGLGSVQARFLKRQLSLPVSMMSQ
ncbi:hypothetical protein [Bosea sp. ANAM02]|uniref:hypothetical protein n=1 Tax=Bosea sp. ANAM02 TaxID=2020412 RepID=UPI00140EE416|nr:hypothetical protein [Bosea sp. ANAM02]BCB17921.1 hypothetical protein OCUBac02_08150 [Bosea sp. ANAM02]